MHIKTLKKQIANSWIFDLFLSVTSIIPAYILLMYRKIGSGTLPMTTLMLRRVGVFPIIDHYYEPSFNSVHVNSDRKLPGLELDDEDQLKLLSALNYVHELLELDLLNVTDAPDKFSIDNSSFESGDAEFLYQFIRLSKPSKIIEVGSGHSTKLARLALLKNRMETGLSYEHICIEPYEQSWLEKLSEVKVIRSKVEDLQLDWELELKSGDLLFIDSSHIIRPNGDILKEYLEIIPSLAPGVIIHVHDIFTPRDYLKSWVVNDVKFWNEQYMLEALLSNGSRYKVIAALNYLKHKHYSELIKVCPYLSYDREPGSFYFKVRDGKTVRTAS